MVVDNIVSFLVQYGASIALDRFVEHIRGENRHNRELEASLKSIRDTTEENLEYVHNQIYEDYQIGLDAIKDASATLKDTDDGLSNPRVCEYIKTALESFRLSSKRKNASGLLKARAIYNKALCQVLLSESNPAINSLKEARGIAVLTAKQLKEKYTQQQQAESIRGKIGGHQADGIRITIEYVAPTSSALELIDEIDQTIKLIQQNKHLGRA